MENTGDIKNCHAGLDSASSTQVVAKENTNGPRGRSQIKFKMTSLCNNGAFTLIELLVVVLIIGILAAVALPQYKLAVQKAEFANYRMIANSAAQSAQTYYLANSQWPSTIDDLDVDFSSIGSHRTQANTCIDNDKMFCCLTFPVPHGADGAIICGKKDYSFAYISQFASDTGAITNAHRCVSKAAEKICQATGGIINNPNAAVHTPSGVVSPVYHYVYRGAER